MQGAFGSVYYRGPLLYHWPSAAGAVATSAVPQLVHKQKGPQGESGRGLCTGRSPAPKNGCLNSPSIAALRRARTSRSLEFGFPAYPDAAATAACGRRAGQAPAAAAERSLTAGGATGRGRWSCGASCRSWPSLRTGGGCADQALSFCRAWVWGVCLFFWGGSFLDCC